LLEISLSQKIGKKYANCFLFLNENVDDTVVIEIDGKVSLFSRENFLEIFMTRPFTPSIRTTMYIMDYFSS
jgi:hypothetical protein